MGLLLVPAMPAQAAATKTSFSATAVLTSGPPVRLWVDDDGVLHIRGQPFLGTITGDLTGFASGVNNINLDLATGSGDLHGSFTVGVAQGTFSGRVSGTISGFLSSGEFVGKSDDGIKIMGTFVEGPPGTLALTGVLLDPSG